MNNATDDKTIQRYLDDDMPLNERNEFEELLKSNVELLQEVEEYKKLQEAVFFHKRRVVWDKVQQLEQQADNRIFRVAPKGNKTNWRYWAVAASITILVVVSFFLWNQYNTPSQELFTEYFEPYSALAYAPDRNADSINNIKEKAMLAYLEQDYPQAILLFEQTLSEENDHLILFYLGNAYLANKQYELSVEVLDSFISYNTVLQSQGYWYLALAHLAIGNISESTRILENLSSRPNTYQEKSNQILNQLN